ncbi:MAG: arylsulfatase [Gemmatimonadetes bacterium]|nr:arylsulfatase [Gemmatimonadota bacterium]
MKKRGLALAGVLVVALASCGRETQSPRPNIVLIVADDLGYGELGSYGQQRIRTPELDRLASEGMRFTRHYSGSPVCAPSRATLLTGLHTGHAVVRDNDEMVERGDVWGDTLIEGNHPLPAETYTIGRMLQDAGYVTAAIGKWGLGGPGDSGEPNLQGFDHWYGYMCQREAHNYYPTHLWRNGKREELSGNPAFRAHQRLPANVDPDDPASYSTYRGATYAMDAMMEEAVAFVREHAAEPFFLYLPFPVPHVALQVPDESVQEYEGRFPEDPYPGDRGYLPNRTPRATYAAMITRMDRGIGDVLRALEEEGVAGNTVVIFTSDNGPTFNGGTDSEFFESTAGLRGLKTMLYEGGIRVPLIVRWPGAVAGGGSTDHISAFWDFMPTLAEIAGTSSPPETDGLSMVPVLTGDPAAQPRHESLYWEYHGGQALLAGHWKAVRGASDAAMELYDIDADPAETTNVAAAHPDVVQRLSAEMASSRTRSEFFPLDRPSAARLGRVRRGCGLIAAATREATQAVPRTTADPGGPGAPDPRCTVQLRVTTDRVPAASQPSDAIRAAFGESGWTEDLGATADGAGTSAFAYSKEDVRCDVSAGRPASLLDGEIVEDGIVYVEASCFTAAPRTDTT